jgi:outer membrane protein
MTRRVSHLVVGLAGLLASVPALSQQEPAPAVTDEGPPSPQPPAPADAPLPFELPVIEPGEPLTLAQAIQLADRRNLTLAATRVELERADAQLKLAWGTLFPIASGQLTFTHYDHEETANLGGTSIVTRPQDNLSGRIDVSLPLVNAQSWLGVHAGRQGREVAELTVASARQALLLSVARAYYQALTALSLIEVNEGQIRSSARYLEVARTRLVSGVGSRLDVLRAKSELTRSREALIAAHAALSNARDALGILTGTGGLPLPTEGPELAAPTASDEDLISAGHDRREDLRLKRALVELADRQLDASWMQFLPSLNASWQLTHQFTEPSQFGSDDRTRWTAFLVLSVPIYNQTRYADLDLKRADVHKATLQADDSAEQAALEIRRARRDFATAVDKVATAAEQATLARETLVLTRSEYISGTGSSLAVNDASRSSREAEINLAAKRFEAQIALLALLRAVGEDMSRLGDAEGGER